MLFNSQPKRADDNLNSILIALFALK